MSIPPDPMNDDDFEAELQRHDLRSDGSPDDEGTWGWTPGRIAATVLLVAIVGFWVWAFSPWAPRGHPDELDDTAFTTYAEDRCTAAMAQVEQVDPAEEAADLLERAGQIETTTDILVVLVDDLEAKAPAIGTRDGDLVARWLVDWRAYIADRYRYAANFRDGIDQAFQVTAIDGDQVTSSLDLFADINGMASCASPPDV